MKYILGVITARGGSKGLPQKNIKILGGKPLIAYTIEQAKKSKLVSHLIISTDDSKIIDIAKQHGVDAPFVRPAELANDQAKHIDVMKHAIQFMENKLGIIFDYVVIFQPTSPFRTADDIDETINKVLKHDADSGYTLVELHSGHPTKIKKIDGDFVKGYFVEELEGARRQDLPKAYIRNGAVYVIKRDVIMKKNRLYGDKIVGHIMPIDRSVDIDNEYDWALAEHMYKKLNQNGFFD